jgi:hypothetical protein
MIAVLRAGGLGDTLLTLPAMQVLRSYLGVWRGLMGPPPRIEVAGNPAFWRATGAADRIFDSGEAWFAGLYGDTPAAELRTWLEGQQTLVAWTARPLGAWVAETVPRVIQVTPYPPPGVHAAAWLRQSLAPLYEQFEYALSAEPANGWLGLTPMERAWGRAALSELGLEHPTILHPGAGAEWKRWPAASFARLALALRARGHQVALVEGPADEEAVREVLAQVGPLPVICETDLRALARMLGRARLFAGNDSGVTHLAAMAGARTIALFGPTDPASWAPLGDVRILRRCRAATHHQGEIRVCADPECMAAIPVEDVLEVINIHC